MTSAGRRRRTAAGPVRGREPDGVDSPAARRTVDRAGHARWRGARRQRLPAAGQRGRAHERWRWSAPCGWAAAASLAGASRPHQQQRADGQQRQHEGQHRRRVERGRGGSRTAAPGACWLMRRRLLRVGGGAQHGDHHDRDPLHDEQRDPQPGAGAVERRAGRAAGRPARRGSRGPRRWPAPARRWRRARPRPRRPRARAARRTRCRPRRARRRPPGWAARPAPARRAVKSVSSAVRSRTSSSPRVTPSPRRTV